VKLLFTILHSKAISGVDNPDDGVGLFKVVSPVRAKRALPANVPCALLQQTESCFDNDSQIFKV